MKSRVLVALLAALAAAPALAQHEGHGAQDARAPTQLEHHGAQEAPAQHEDRGAQESPAQHENHGGQETRVDAAPPPAAFSGPAHAADTVFDPGAMAEARDRLRAEDGGANVGMMAADRFETRAGDGDESYAWDLQGWYGGDINKAWLKSEGEGGLGDNPDDVELQALYSRAITPFFDFQVGLRHDFRPDPERSHLVLGIQGLLPQVFEIDAAAFLSDEGDLSGRVEAEYDLRISQRLVLQPRMELDFAARAVPELGIGPGVGSLAGGFRLRYEIQREIAPYLGIAWQRKLGGTADFARASDRDVRRWEAAVGVRLWF